MATYSINIESRFPVDSLENVLKNIEWIKRAGADAGVSAKDPIFNSSFSVGELSCECKSEEELRTEALGQKVCFSDTMLYYQIGDEHIAFSFHPCRITDDGKNAYISCNDKTLLSTVMAHLKTADTEIKESSLGPVVIQANNVSTSNIIVGSGNTSTVNAAAQSGKKSFWKDIWAGILKNIIWVIIVAVILIVLAFLGITKPEWLQL